MAKSIKLKNDTYWDSKSIDYKHTNLEATIDNIKNYAELLFAGNAGSSDTITPPAGDSFSNYKFLIFTAGWWGQRASAMIVPYISGQDYSMSSFVQTANNVYWLNVGCFIINANSITIRDGGQMNLMDPSSYVQNYDCFKITRVYGIK